MTKTDQLKKLILQKYKCFNQPQLFNASLIRKQLKIPTSGGPDFISTAICNMKNAGALERIGSVRDTHFYVLTDMGKIWLEHGSHRIINLWINRGRNWRSSMEKTLLRRFNG